MVDYAAYGLILRSSIVLPELVAAPTSVLTSAPRPKGDVDVVISLAPPTEQPLPDGNSCRAWATSDCAFVDYPQTASFLVREGHEILVRLAPDADPSLVRLYLLGPILALLLHQRKFLVLHASAVDIDGRAVAFLGEKGMGKSTMAAALHARGRPLIADDVVAIETNGPEPIAYPGFPQLKLFPESAALVDAAPLSLPRIHPHFDKRARKVEAAFAAGPLPLRKIFVLTDGEAETVQPLPPSQAFMEFVRHSYLLAYLKATGSAQHHFHQATKLAARVPVARLIRRRSFDALPNLAAIVEGEIERAA